MIYVDPQSLEQPPNHPFLTTGYWYCVLLDPLSRVYFDRPLPLPLASAPAPRLWRSDPQSPAGGQSCPCSTPGTQPDHTERSQKSVRVNPDAEFMNVQFLRGFWHNREFLRLEA
jgi:hypothetical protein